MAENGAATRRRVKLYMLNEERQWDDKGTGHVSSVFVESLNGIALLVVSEADGSTLLESRIQPDTAYQKQQETLIVWSEAESMDLALSFQEKDGCDEIWGKICSVQGKDPSVEITQDVVDEDNPEEGDDTESETGSACGQPPATDSLVLPPCELSWLGDLVKVVTSPSVLSIVGKRERLVGSLLRQGYLRRVCTDLFRQAEEADDRKSLGQLHEVIRNIFYLNNKSVFEVMFADDVILDVIGILEYDPAKPVKANHREFLLNRSRHCEVLPIQKADLRSKIHQTFRVQYIQDCILPTPSMFDDNQFSELSSFLFVNKVSILNDINNDDKLMTMLFACLRDKSNSAERRLELTMFLKELCNFSCLLEPPEKDLFFKSLMQHQALDCLTPLYSKSCTQLRSALTDILFAFVDHSPVLLRDHMLKETSQDNHQLLINVLIQQMCSDPDPEMGDALRLAGLIRILVDPESMLTNSQPSNMYQRSAAEKTEFLRFFYHRAMPTLLEPLYSNTHDEAPLKDGYRSAQLLYHILDLLAFCIEQHTYHVKNLVLAKDLIRRVLVLLRSRHSFLVLGALKLFRRVVGLKDEFYNRYLTKNALFRPIIALFIRNGPRYNLINSAIIELFDFISTEGIRSLIIHVTENHWEALREVQYVTTFRAMRQRYESYQQTDQLKDKARDVKRSSPSVDLYSQEPSLAYPRSGGGATDGPLSSMAAVAAANAAAAAAAAAVAAANFSSPSSSSPSASCYRMRRDPRDLDADEEQWFEQDEADQQPQLPPLVPTSMSAAAAMMAAAGASRTGVDADERQRQHQEDDDEDEEDDEDTGVVAPVAPKAMMATSAAAGSAPPRPLVDYPDDHDDSDQEEDDDNAVEATAAPTATITTSSPGDALEDAEAPAAKRLRTEEPPAPTAPPPAALPSMMETYAGRLTANGSSGGGS
ncbi:hypothetical protein BOX15_Mlig023888g1 [Macrostomum lignano]|uniref:Uncharacterized protein n=2 Tax=Macrostomum lignano TaxID=282301 RepID=A0A267H422_9PLAT|nr:hypothetical protein BOX15_Mlig023888g1 [Macrostomum lignano]